MKDADLKLNCHQAKALQIIDDNSLRNWPRRDGYVQVGADQWGPRVGIKVLRNRQFIATTHMYRHALTDLGRAALAAFVAKQ